MYQASQLSFSSGIRRAPIYCMETTEGCPIQPGASLQRVRVPIVLDNKCSYTIIGCVYYCYRRIHWWLTFNLTELWKIWYLKLHPAGRNRMIAWHPQHSFHTRILNKDSPFWSPTKPRLFTVIHFKRLILNIWYIRLKCIWERTWMFTVWATFQLRFHSSCSMSRQRKRNRSMTSGIKLAQFLSLSLSLNSLAWSGKFGIWYIVRLLYHLQREFERFIIDWHPWMPRHQAITIHYYSSGNNVYHIVLNYSYYNWSYLDYVYNNVSPFCLKRKNIYKWNVLRS